MTDTSINGELLDRLQLELADHRGSQNAITTDALAVQIGINDGGTHPKVREAVKELMRERDIPVVSDYNGYYIPDTRDEVDDYLSNLDSRITGIQERKQLLEQAADTRLATDGGEHA